MQMSIIDYVTIVCIIALGLALTLISLRSYNKHKYGSWIKLLFAGVGVLWSLIYMIVLLVPEHHLGYRDGILRILVRPAVLLTLSSIIAEFLSNSQRKRL